MNKKFLKAFKREKDGVKESLSNNKYYIYFFLGVFIWGRILQIDTGYRLGESMFLAFLIMITGYLISSNKYMDEKDDSKWF